MKTPTDTYNIYYDKTLNVVIMEWNGYATSSQFREGTEYMLNTLIQNKCSGVLADIRDMTIIGMEDLKWLETIFLPRATTMGFKTIAIISPTSYFNKVAIESILDKVDQKKIHIQLFESHTEAIGFLKTA